MADGSELSIMAAMHHCSPPALLTLATLYLQNQQSFVARRSLQRFLVGELTAQEAIARIRQYSSVPDNTPIDAL